MNEKAEKALKAALMKEAPGMPAGLKAALKREARSRARRAASPSLLETLRAALGAAPWSYGLGAAFATAALVLAVRASLTRRPEAAPSREVAAQMEKISADLWSDDDGSDRDD